MLSHAYRGALTRAIGTANCNVSVSVVYRNTTKIVRPLSSKDDSSFQQRRPTPRAFKKAPKRKIRHKKAKDPIMLNSKDPSVGLEAEAALNYLKRYGDATPSVEASLRAADYLTAEHGTTEDLVGERRALMETASPQEAERFRKALKEMVQEEKDNSVFAEDFELPTYDNDEKEGLKEDDNSDILQKAYGDWSETIIKVDRVQKVQRGGTMVSYRALVIGGNLNGCAGFGVGKAKAPNDAVAHASRKAKRNIFFVDRYLGSGLTTDLVGRHNSCKVMLWCVPPNRGLHGHPLIQEILKYFGITDCSAKSHGNRNPFNVVYATFKAIMTHESMEEIALKRGKRLLNLERAKRLQI